MTVETPSARAAVALAPDQLFDLTGRTALVTGASSGLGCSSHSPCNLLERKSWSPPADLIGWPPCARHIQA